MKKMEKMENGFVKSPLNYIGGKYKLLPQLLPLFPRDIDTFIDLFSGGGNVGVNVRAKKCVLNDMNYKVNEMLRYFVQSNPNELFLEIEDRINAFALSKTNEKGFLDFREQYNTNPNPLDLYILVAYSYNYQLRFNNSLQFNNPFGKNRSCFSTNMKNNLNRFIDRCQKINVSFVDGFFSDFDFSLVTSSDFVYLDPPYLITTGNYNDGNRGFLNWTLKQELEMYSLLEQLTINSVKWALSNVLEHKGKKNNSLINFIENNKYQVNYLDYTYKNSSYNTCNKNSVEVLITNYNVDSFELLQ